MKAHHSSKRLVNIKKLIKQLVVLVNTRANEHREYYIWSIPYKK